MTELKTLNDLGSNAGLGMELERGTMEPKINIEPDAWATTDMCLGPNYGKTKYDKLPIQSMNPLQYTHEKLYSEKTVIGLMKAAYYDGYTDREDELRKGDAVHVPLGGWAHTCKDGKRHTTFEHDCPHKCGARYVPNAKVSEGENGK